MKTVLITGGARGIGKAIAEKFAQNNYNILLAARHERRLLETAQQLAKKYPEISIATFAGDLSDLLTADRMVEHLTRVAIPDILINNAGTYEPGDIATEQTGTLEKMIAVNLYSAYHVTRAALPYLLSKGKGYIFNICSVAGLKAYPGGGSYSISKFALNGFSKNLREELREKNIRVTEIFPGAVLTDSWGDFDNSENRIMETSDVAEMIYAATLLNPQSVPEEIVLRPLKGDL